ncbi:MAG: hypothetical protein KJO69_03365 [Gammaproteobacteria bacterium]|nr:hypothetical protein [Gammaproteobacteria bacterium]
MNIKSVSNHSQGTISVVVLIVVIAVISTGIFNVLSNNSYSEERARTEIENWKYEALIRKMKSHPDIKPMLSMSLEDNVITNGEYDNIEEFIVQKEIDANRNKIKQTIVEDSQ